MANMKPIQCPECLERKMVVKAELIDCQGRPRIWQCTNCKNVEVD